MDDVCASVQTWDDGILNTAGRQIKMHIFWVEFGSNTILGGSYSPTNGDGTTACTYGEHIWRDGVNYDGRWDGWDTIIRYDVTAAGFSWNFGAGSPGTGQIDFRSVVTHEIGHSIGFWPTYDSTPAYDDWGNAWGTESSPYSWAGYRGLTEWDKHLRDDAGNCPVNGGTGTPGNFNQVDNPVWWTGSYANSLYGSSVPIYAPDPYEPGSSLSHLNETSLPNALMSPAVGLGQMVRQPLAVEWEMMKDMTWTIVPEPGTMAILLFGLCGWLRRR